MTVVARELRMARSLRAPSCQAAKGLRHRIGSDEFGEREVPFMPWGLQNRLARIIRPSDGHTVMLAADHGYFLGPTHKLEIPRKTLEPLLPFADAVMVTRGVVRTSIDPGANVPIVLRVSGGASVLNEDLSNEKITTSMKEAVRLNASAVALSIFVGATHEHDSLVNLGKLVDEGEDAGVPVLAVTAVGKELEKRDARYLGLACRIASEFGAHFVKTYYADDFSKVVESCPVPLVVVDGPKPRIGPGEILVKVRSSGICGSDVMEWYRRPKAPLVLGHEIAAEVVEVGAGVDRVKVGDRVFVSHHVPCGQCRYCVAGHETVCDTLRTTNFDPGGFAEFVRVPAVNVKHGVFALPKGISDDEGVLVEPFACVVRGQRLAGFRPGHTVVVIGSGVAGLLHVKLAKASGAAKVIATDIVEYRKAAARKAGADVVIDGREDVPAKVREANDGLLAKYVITCTGAPKAIVQGLGSVDRGGTVLFFAPSEPTAKVEIPFNAVWREEVTMTSSYGGRPRDIQEAIELLATRQVTVADLITHLLPPAEAGKGFRLVAQAADLLKVVLRP